MKQIYTITLNPAFDIHYDMESFQAEKENYVQSIRQDAGGKGINTSRALTVNGHKNVAYLLVGEENGDAFLQQLKRDKMEYKKVTVPGRIRENITLHPKNQKETRISLDTFSVSENAVNELLSELKKQDLSNALISFSGRLPRGISKEFAIGFLKNLIRDGARVIVDSNSFSTDDLIAIHPWFVKPNDQEIESVIGRKLTDKADAERCALELVHRGLAEEVMISLGGDGAVWSDGRITHRFSVPKLEHPVSTIGAGDSTLAGLLAGTALSDDKAENLRLALAYGTSACMTPGTNPPLPKDVENVRKQVKIED